MVLEKSLSISDRIKSVMALTLAMGTLGGGYSGRGAFLLVIAFIWRDMRYRKYNLKMWPDVLKNMVLSN